MAKDGQRRTWGTGTLWVVVNTFSWALSLLIGMAAAWLIWEIYQADSIPIRFLSDETNRMLLTFMFQGIGWGALIGFLQQMVLKQHFDLDGRAWVFATMIGMTLYILFSQAGSFITYDLRVPERYIYGLNIFTLFVGSALLGTAQWVIMRHSFQRAGFWILASVIALSAAPMVFNLFHSSRYGGNGRVYLVYSISYLLITGLIYGLVTWITLALISRQSLKPLQSQPESGE